MQSQITAGNSVVVAVLHLGGQNEAVFAYEGSFIADKFDSDR